MDKPLPQIKTVRVMLKEMDEQQIAVFAMAFKMHQSAHYEIVTEGSAEKPDLVLVDTDTHQGYSVWKTLKAAYPDIPVAVFSIRAPLESAPYMPKPVRFDTLFPLLRSLVRGGSISQAESAKSAAGTLKSPAPKKATIHRFNPQKGLLGALRFAASGRQDIAILYEGKPVLVVFPDIRRVLLTIKAAEIEKLSRNDDLEVVCKAVPDNPQWKEKAKITIESCLWQISIWSARGRLIYPMTPQTVFTLKNWPNLTRLAPIPESMRLSAFLVKTSVNLNVLYKVMPLEITHVLNYIAATYVTGFLSADCGTPESASGAAEQIQNRPLPSEGQMEQLAAQAANPTEGKTRGLLQRLMKKLLG